MTEAAAARDLEARTRRVHLVSRAILAVGFVVVNFIVDILYAVLDPRIRHARAIG